MPVPYIFTKGDPVEATKVNDDFAYVLTSIQEAVEGASGELTTQIDAAKTAAQVALTKANNSVQLSGNQTINGQKTFNNLVIVPNSTTNGSAISQANLLKRNQADGASYIKLGNGILIQWGRGSHTSDRDSVQISLPLSYTATGSYQVVATSAIVGYAGNVSYGNIGAHKDSETRFTVYSERSANYPSWFQWIAIGY